MSRTNKAIKNISYNLGYQILIIILGFASRSIFLYFLNVEYLGVQSFFREVLTLLSMADLGLSTAMTFSFYKPLSEGNQAYISALVQYYKKIYNGIALGIFFLGLVLMPLIESLINLDTGITNLRLYYLLTLLNTVASYLVAYKNVVLVADQKGHITAKYGSIIYIVQNIVLALALWLTQSFSLYLSIQIFFTCIYNFTISIKTSQEYPYLKNKRNLPEEDRKGLFKNIQSVFIYKLSIVMLNATDNSIISVIIGTAMVGYYSNYNMVVTRITSLVTTIFNSLTSSIGSLIVEESEERRFEIFEIIQGLSSILSVFVVSVVAFLLQDFILVWLGREFLLDNFVLATIILNLYLSLVLLPILSFREATGLYQQMKYVMLVTAFLNIGLSILLGHLIGLGGILLATSVARILTHIWYEPHLLFGLFFGRNSGSYFKSLGKSSFVICLLLVIGYYMAPLFEVITIGDFFIKTVTFSVLTIFILVLAYWKNPGFQYLQSKVKR
ncbi:lipopolysaccharide biosynthesis protein [Streptococcus suis]